VASYLSRDTFPQEWKCCEKRGRLPFQRKDRYTSTLSCCLNDRPERLPWSFSGSSRLPGVPALSEANAIVPNGKKSGKRKLCEGQNQNAQPIHRISTHRVSRRAPCSPYSAHSQGRWPPNLTGRAETRRETTICPCSEFNHLCRRFPALWTSNGQWRVPLRVTPRSYEYPSPRPQTGPANRPETAE
jgi:hypothetical protein